MKNWLIIVLIAAINFACGSQKQVVENATESRLESDSLSYEITIMDAGFDQWYKVYFSPAMDRDNSYYQMKNRIGVSNWNDYYIRGKHRAVIGSFIHYNPAEDYGIEVNRQLYWYFKYIEESFRVQLLQ